MADYQFDFSSNPAWRPLTEGDRAGYAFLAASAAVLIGLTLWTYLGNARVTGRRLVILISLRLVALLIAMLSALRPSLSVTDKPKEPSTLLFAIDVSESMTIRDESNNSSRWDFMRKFLEKAGPTLEALKAEQQVSVQMFAFARDFDPARDGWNPATAKPDGKRTDFGTMLAKLYDRYSREPKLRGLIVLSDGADNGTAKPALAEAERYRGAGFPIYAFAVGQTSTPSDARDVALTAISTDPSPAPIKSDVKIKVTADAQGFAGSHTKMKLYLNDVLQRTEDVVLPKERGNELEMAIKAPEKPGEVKVRVELVPQPGESTDQNNSIESYLSVTKEGVRVLVIHRLHPDMHAMRVALASDKRFDFVEAVRQTDEALPEAERLKFDLDENAYDVLVLANVTPRRLRAIDPKFMERVERRVRERGMGLIMLGGQDSFAGSADTAAADRWAGTPIANLLPVSLGESRQVDAERIGIIPTRDGLDNFMLKLDPDAKKNAEIWRRLNDPTARPNSRLQGFTPVGTPKPGHVRFADALRENGQKEPLMVGWNAGTGRVLAFGENTLGGSWRKLNPEAGEGYALAQRFWKQVILWLAHQDEIEGNVYARPLKRRLAQNDPQTVEFGVRDKRGEDIPTAEIKYQILAPGEKADEAKAKPPGRDAQGKFAAAFDTRQPGEYRVVAWGRGTGADGKEIKGDAAARFIIFPDISDELLKPAANHDLMLALENAANNTALDAARRVDRLPAFLEDLLKNPVQTANAKSKLYPDWRRDANGWFLPALLVLFAAILGSEWGLRRVWGMI